MWDGTKLKILSDSIPTFMKKENVNTYVATDSKKYIMMTTTIVTICGKTRNLISSWFVQNIPLSENILKK